MSSNQGPIDRRADLVQQEIDARTSRLAGTLRDELTLDDAQNVPQAQWHDMIRRNWADPQWRQQTAERVGDLSLVNDAMDAFGMPKSALRDYAAQGHVPPAGL